MLCAQQFLTPCYLGGLWLTCGSQESLFVGRQRSIHVQLSWTYVTLTTINKNKGIHPSNMSTEKDQLSGVAWFFRPVCLPMLVCLSHNNIQGSKTSKWMKKYIQSIIKWKCFGNGSREKAWIRLSLAPAFSHPIFYFKKHSYLWNEGFAF